MWLRAPMALAAAAMAAPAMICSEPPTPMARWQTAEVVVATIEKIRTDPLTLLVRVSEQWKGPERGRWLEIRPNLEVLTDFQPGQVWLFHLAALGQRYAFAFLCGGFRSGPAAEEDLRFLRGLPDAVEISRLSGTVTERSVLSQGNGDGEVRTSGTQSRDRQPRSVRVRRVAAGPVSGEHPERAGLPRPVELAGRGGPWRAATRERPVPARPLGVHIRPCAGRSGKRDRRRLHQRGGPGRRAFDDLFRPGRAVLDLGSGAGPVRSEGHGEWRPELLSRGGANGSHGSGGEAAGGTQ